MRFPIRSLACVAAAAISSLALAQSPATTQATPPYVGTFEYRYPGIVIRCETRDAKTLRWTIVEGGPVGQSEEETVDRRTIAPGIEFVSWTEKSGAMVVQVADFNAMRLTTALIVNGQRLVLAGTITRIAP